MNYYGYPSELIQNTHYGIEYLRNAGPRIVGFRLRGSDKNLLAETPGEGWKTAHGEYRLYGGHRLWYAPEQPDLTGFPDNDALLVEPLPNGVELVQAVERITGLRRALRVELEPDGREAKLTHRLENQSSCEMEIAPWAITMLPLGGTVILPQANAPLGNGYLPNRNLVLWPYARWDDPRVIVKEDHLLVRGEDRGQLLKIGYYNPYGWAAYWHAETLFCKRFAVLPGANYPDRGCNLEVYINSHYAEMESLGPLERVQPGKCVSLVETWEALPAGRMPEDLEEAWLAAARLCGHLSVEGERTR